jgi:hypothetical protein
MDYGLFEEALTDFFNRMSHDPAVARSRAAAIIRIARSCDEEIVGGDRGMEIVLHCSEIIPIVPYIEYTEAEVALRTLDAFLEEKGRS